MMRKKGAMEMSMGTIVTIVLLMSVLVLGIFFVQKIFTSGNKSIDQIDNQVQNEINKLFSDENMRVVVYPSSEEITIKKGRDPSGFAFAIMNDFQEITSFTWNAESVEGYNFEKKCGPSMTKEKADDFILSNTGKFDLGPNAKSRPSKVFFKIPKTAPSCTIPYTLDVRTADGTPYESVTVYVTIK